MPEIQKRELTAEQIAKMVRKNHKHCNGDGQQARKRREKMKQLAVRYGRKCINCGETREELLTLDHIIPLSKGGSRGRLDNLQILCFGCNIGKSDATVNLKTGKAR